MVVSFKGQKGGKKRHRRWTITRRREKVHLLGLGFMKSRQKEPDELIQDLWGGKKKKRRGPLSLRKGKKEKRRKNDTETARRHTL